MPDFNPPSISKPSSLPFHEQSWEEFEKLCLDMVEVLDGFSTSETYRYGIRGQMQQGIDIYGRNNDNTYNTYQCKHIQSLEPGDLRKIVDRFRKGTWYPKTKKFVLALTCPLLRTELLEEFEILKSELAVDSIMFEKWDHDQINRLLVKNVGVVYENFGGDWAKIWCGAEVFDRAISARIVNGDIYKQEIKRGSFQMQSIHGSFGKQGIHLERDETEQLYQWIITDLQPEQRSLAVLEGGAGGGKTVIIKDLYNKLVADNIPVLGLKADKFQSSELTELEKKIFGKDNIHIVPAISSIALKEKLVVVIIDQIDALSQSLSSNRDFMTTYCGLIHELIALKGVRVVISARTFDLEYDDDLRYFKSKGFKNIKAKQLTIPQVERVIRSLSPVQPSEQLVELLRTPNHLNIFCKIDFGSGNNPLLITTQKQLYDELWRSILSSYKEKDKLKKLIFKLADQMNIMGITVPNIYEEEFSDELAYSFSHQLIEEEKGGLQFFHQTFYEFAFAKHFVDSDSDLRQFLSTQHQGIYIRSVVKLVTDYLREKDNHLYTVIIRELLNDSHTRFHIQSLLITGFNHIPFPSKGEKAILTQIILPQKKYGDLFFNTVSSQGWYTFLLESGLLYQTVIEGCQQTDQDQKLNWVINIVSRHFLNQQEPSIKFLQSLPDLMGANNVIAWVLYDIKDWRDERLLPMFEKHIIYDHDVEHGSRNVWYYEILQKIAKYHLQFVINLVSPVIGKLFNDEYASNDTIFEEEFLKRINEAFPDETFKMIYAEMMSSMELHKDESQYEFSDLQFYHTNFPADDQYNIDPHPLQSKVLEITIEYVTQHYESQWYEDFFTEHCETNNVTILGLLMTVLTTVGDANRTVRLIEILDKKKVFQDFEGKFQTRVRAMIGANFALMNHAQKQMVTDILLKVSSPFELKIHKALQIPPFPNNLGNKQFEYLKALPFTEILASPTLKRKYFELSRKLGVQVAETTARHVNAEQVNAPLNQMPLENWKNYLKDYYIQYGNGLPDDMPKRQIIRFRENEFIDLVTKEPLRFFPLVKEMFEQPGFPVQFMTFGLQGLVRGKYPAEQLTEIFEQYLEISDDVYHVIYALSMFSHFSGAGKVSRKIFSYVNNLVLHFQEYPITTDKQAQPEIRKTIRSKAMKNLCYCFRHNDFHEEIFLTAETVVKENHTLINSEILEMFPNLWAIDQQRAFRLFTKIIQMDNLLVFRISFICALRLKNTHADQMHSFFDLIFSLPDCLTNESIRIFVDAYFKDQQELMPYYERLLQQGDKVVSILINIIEQYFETYTEKALTAYLNIVGLPGKDIAGSFSGLILRKFKLVPFQKVWPFLQQYAASPSVNIDPGYYFSYLIGCVNEHYYQCLELFSQFTFNEVSSRRLYLEKYPVQLVLALYTRFSKIHDVDQRYMETLMNIFDQILRSEGMRNKADAILETVDV
ncbi:NACHT domain-containing protein [Pedobacter gandavensis]|uniref:AAA family ATPase n=1 Tax=Pedobacter gandavensis TaxID=2679963 RepID=A0ABR6F4K2_9SPHI|nr:AAA family ATPase [Pedobacter gandavensis]MBB2151633.1 AAA family ATPase [Pedobacter gandavensis]